MGFNLKQQLIFYGAYHNEPTNIAIHMACVPLLLATGQILLTNTPNLPTPSSLSRLNLPLNVTTVVSAAYSALYLVLSPNVAGATLAPLVLGGAALANRLSARYAAATAKLSAVAGGVHVAAWILQFVGHARYEGRRPALVDNIAQALFLAPLFVWYEGLFAMGFYKGLKREVEAGVEAELGKLKAGNGKDE